MKDQLHDYQSLGRGCKSHYWFTSIAQLEEQGKKSWSPTCQHFYKMEYTE